MEYATTSDTWVESVSYYEENVPADIPNPIPPKGDGWNMCGSTAVGTRLFWFWVRRKQISAGTESFPSNKGRKKQAGQQAEGFAPIE